QLCTLYWPSREEEPVTFNGITVRLQSETVMAHYCIRIFSVLHQGYQHHVFHYQMTCWCDKTRPDSPIPMLSLLKRIRTSHKQSQKPIIVHCSAGAGRTGTFIATDLLLDQAATEHAVDIDDIIHRLRRERPWMVQTLTQYIFIHELLMKAFKLGELFMTPASTCPSPRSVEDTFQDLKSDEVKETCYRSGKLAENLEKNRNRDIIPVADFWRMIYDYDVNTILLLDKLDEADNQQPINSLSVTIYQYLDCSSERLIPSDHEQFLDLVPILEQSTSLSRHIVIQCL
ncbi:hypothetical protein LSH36_13g23026, partial [Paralvinella palmiformis]